MNCALPCHAGNLYLPPALLDLPRWTPWGNGDTTAKMDKRPWWETNQPAKWKPYALALAAATGASGVGFQVAGQDELVVFDADHVVTSWDPTTRTAKLTERGARLVAAAGAMYVEVSPSMTGLRFIGTRPPSLPVVAGVTMHKFKDGSGEGFEVYGRDSSRYATITGWALAGRERLMGDVPREFIDLIEREGVDVKWEGVAHARDDLRDPERPTGEDGKVIVARARTDISSIQAVDGQFGDRTTFMVACILVNDYRLSEISAWDLLVEWNRTNATPPWPEEDLRAKLKSAVKNAKYPAGSRLDGDHPAWPIDRRVPASIFPHRKISATGRPGAPLLTEQNVERLLLAYDIRPWFDVIMKQPRAEGSGAPVGELGRNSLLVVRATSLANLNGLPAGDALKTMVGGQAFKCPRNPVTEWMDGMEPWDGVTDYITELASTVTVDDVEENVWKRVLRLHMIQSCAAADGAQRTGNFDARPQYGYVLVFYGNQGVRKDTWFRAYVGPDMQAYYSAAQSMNPSNKDDIIQNTSMWIVSLNEIDAIFSQSDQSMLKGFLDRTRDQYRVPYGIAFEDWPRRTSFTGTVNQHEFLRDPTGGRRFWPVTVLYIRPPDPALVRKAWAQSWALYLAGEQWWPDEEFEDELNRHRAAYTQMAEVAQAFVVKYGYPTLKAKGYEELLPSGEVWLQPAEIYKEIFGRPAGNDHKGLSLLGTWLTKNNLDRHGKPDFRKRRGMKYWRIPSRPVPPPSGRLPNESD